jgi:hypothetical protein
VIKRIDPDSLIDEYLEEKEYVENRKPYWLFVDAQDGIEYGLFNYFPEAHYKNAIDQAFKQKAEDRVLDGEQTNLYRDDEPKRRK